MAGALFPSDTEIDQLVVGPESIAWRSTSDVRLNFAVLYPLLLQVAHPTIDAAVSDYSDFDERPWDRLLATADCLNLLVYGGRDAAAFVRATACFTTAIAPADTERFYREYRGLGRLIGVRERDLPATWVGFRAYFRRTARYQLSRTRSADRVLNAIRGIVSAPAPIPNPLWRAIALPARLAVWLGGVGLMDTETRRRLEIRWTKVDEAEFAMLGALSRGLTPVMPASLKITGPEHLRLRTRVIAHGPLG